MLDTSLKPVPNADDFYKLFKKILGKNIEEYPLLAKRELNKDNTLYVALVSFASGLIGEAKVNSDTNEIKSSIKFIKSAPMQALKNDVYGTGYENSSRKYCFNWIKRIANK